MGKIYEQISDELTFWIKKQKVFFVATAPLSTGGHINCSPKGGDSFRIVDPLTVVYQDFTGSGAETIAHLRENGRMIIMFCAFEGPPKIVRLHGKGEVVRPDHSEFHALADLFPSNPGLRAFIRMRVSRISDSCGFGVPLLKYQGERDTLEKWAETLGSVQLETYRQEKNKKSIDGLPALDNT